MTYNPSIFKAYDIRGLVGKDWDLEFVEALGRAFVLYTKAETVVIGRDMRGSSVEYVEALARGIMKQGADVVDIGLVSSPMFYWAVANYDLHDAGIMVTASHNPAEYNGFKMVWGDAMPMGRDSGGLEIAKLVDAGNFPDAPEGTLVETDINQDYLDRIFELVPAEEIGRMTVVADAANGTSGIILPGIFNRLANVKVSPLFWEPDGSFPNHEANPLKEETLVDLKKKIQQVKADAGFAFDGDSDRMGLVDENGETVRADQIVALLAQILLPGRTGKKVVTIDTRCSRVVNEVVELLGGTTVLTQVGHALIKPVVRSEGAVFGGELSGHFYFGDFGAAENTDYLMLLVMSYLTKTGRSLAELVEPFRKYFHSGEINFTIEDKAGTIARIKERYAPTANAVIEIDGLRIDFDDWWLSVRSSNTEPVLRLNIEADTKEKMEEKVRELSAAIERR